MGVGVGCVMGVEVLGNACWTEKEEEVSLSLGRRAGVETAAEEEEGVW